MSAMKKIGTVSGMTLALVAVATAAGAQIVVRPEPVPMPLVVPTPRVVIAPPVVPLEPIVVDLGSLPRPIGLPDLAISLSEIQASAAEQARATAAQTKAATDAAREAARAVAETHAWEAQNYTYTYNMSHDGDYNTGKDLMIRRQYEQAIVRFDKVIAKKGANVDGALYWKAYSQSRLGKTEESLATIAQLRKDHAQSPYVQDARALEAEAKRMAGKPVNPADVDDEDLKLLAISGLMKTDPDRAVPAAEQLLKSSTSLGFQRRVLYTLAFSNQPRAYQILLNYAKGAGNPDLQLEAIRYITANRNNNNKVSSTDLMQIYQATQNTDVKLAVISALRTSENRSELARVVTSSNEPILIRTSALNGLTGILSPQDLWTLYEKEQNKELRMQMVSAFGSMQALDQLSRVIKTEKDPEIRRRALGSLGSMKSEKSGQILVDLYSGEQDVDAKKSIISSLSRQNNDVGLVAIAKKESSLPLKMEIVRKLSDMAPRSKVAADYLAEIIR